MRQSVGALPTAFFLSVALHAAMLGSVWRTPGRNHDVQIKHSVRVSLSTSPSQRSVIDAGQPSQRPTSHSRTSTLSVPAVAHPVKTDVVPVQSNKFEDAVPMPKGQDSSAGNEETNDRAGDNSVDALKEMTQPCQYIKLPSLWMDLDGFWPRSYRVELQSNREGNMVFLSVLQMRAEQQAAEALDKRIVDEFASCLKKQVKKLDEDGAQHNGTLNPSLASAYSLTIEFYPTGVKFASTQDY